MRPGLIVGFVGVIGAKAAGVLDEFFGGHAAEAVAVGSEGAGGVFELCDSFVELEFEGVGDDVFEQFDRTEFNFLGFGVIAQVLQDFAVAANFASVCVNAFKGEALEGDKSAAEVRLGTPAVEGDGGHVEGFGGGFEATGEEQDEGAALLVGEGFEQFGHFA